MCRLFTVDTTSYAMATKRGKKEVAVFPTLNISTEGAEHLTVKLTMKRKAFAEWYVHPDVRFNGTEACRRAGYRGSQNTLAQIARQNIRIPAIAQYIDWLITQAAAKISAADITIDKVLQDIEVDKMMARAKGNHSAAIRASELQGKYLKMFTERIEHLTPIEEIPDDVLMELLLELMPHILKGASDEYISGILAQHGAGKGRGADTPGTEKPH